MKRGLLRKWQIQTEKLITRLAPVFSRDLRLVAAHGQGDNSRTVSSKNFLEFVDFADERKSTIASTTGTRKASPGNSNEIKIVYSDDSLTGLWPRGCDWY